MTSFKDMGVRTKLTALLGIFVIGILIFGAVGYNALQTVKIGSDLSNSIETAQNLDGDFSPPDASLEPAAFMIYRLMMNTDPTKTQSYLDKFADVEKLFNQRQQYWMANLPDSPMKDLLRKTYSEIDPYFTIADSEVLPLIKAGKIDEANHLRVEKLLPIYMGYEKFLDIFMPLADHDTAEAKATAQATVRKRLLAMVVVLVTCIALAGLVGWFIAQTISHGLKLQVEVLRKVASGDLSERATVESKDEIGQLGTVVNEMSENLSAMVADIRANSETLSSASEELTQTSQQLGATSQETSTQANAVSAAAEQVSQNVATVSTATEEMTASIKEIAKNATDAASVANNAARLAATTNTTMTKLSDSSAQIGNVIKVITSIAEQTNLLALNATIEAARAGEAGKGFAVVANEVKELAKETAKATEDIGQRVEAIQVDAKGAVTAIDEITAVIGKINDIQNTIASSVEEQTAATNEIARNVGETAKGSTEIASNITGVAQAALETQQTATGAQQAAADLSQLARRLQDVVGRFKLADGNGSSRSMGVRANGQMFGSRESAAFNGSPSQNAARS